MHLSLPLTIMTLLKVLYFAHAWYLAKAGRPLIAQPFEAWKYGPVNRIVYDQLKEYGARAIDKKLVLFDPVRLGYFEARPEFSAEISKFLDDVFDYYVKFHPFTLSDLTHERGSPWDQVWSQAANNAVPGMIISNELIRSWFVERGDLYRTNRERGQAS